MLKITRMLHQAMEYLVSVITHDGRMVVATLILLLGAIYLGGTIARIISRERPRRMRHLAANYIARLMPTIAACVALACTAYYAHSHAIHPPAFYFLFKISLAWLIARFVYSITSKQEAGWIVSVIILPLASAYMLGITDDLSLLLGALSVEFGSQKITALMILKGLCAIIVLFWLASRLIGMLQARMNRVTGLHISHRTLVVKTVQITLYFLVFIISLQIIGVDLTALSVFGGALGVGLGFGLQKIASNFISGIILLMERSIEVGDMVELQDGTVGFIRRTGARYTLMETTDSREILIPNEEFITQRAISWTHSNQIGRIVIQLGVAYESDLELVQKIMLQAATDYARCVPNPPPICVLEQFGESSVVFGLYFYIDKVNEGRMEHKSNVMFTIWRAFQSHGIHIPYPQRVVHHLHMDDKTKGFIDA